MLLKLAELPVLAVLAVLSIMAMLPVPAELLVLPMLPELPVLPVLPELPELPELPLLPVLPVLPELPVPVPTQRSYITLFWVILHITLFLLPYGYITLYKVIFFNKGNKINDSTTIEHITEHNKFYKWFG